MVSLVAVVTLMTGGEAPSLLKKKYAVVDPPNQLLSNTHSH